MALDARPLKLQRLAGRGALRFNVWVGHGSKRPRRTPAGFNGVRISLKRRKNPVTGRRARCRYAWQTEHKSLRLRALRFRLCGAS
eukprot:361734-Chlamydomonas_euryale.AAC.4